MKKKFVKNVGCVVILDGKKVYYTVLFITCYFLPVTIMLVSYR